MNKIYLFSSKFYSVMFSLDKLFYHFRVQESVISNTKQWRKLKKDFFLKIEIEMKLTAKRVD